MRRTNNSIDLPSWVMGIMIALALGYMGVTLILPLAVILHEALKEGVPMFLATFEDSTTISAIYLTLFVAAIAVPLNLVMGVIMAWLITKHDFKGKAWLTTIVDLPFSVSPVVSGLIYVLIFGAQGWLGPWLAENDIQIIFAVPGLVLATIFVTFPFIARQLIPLMASQGRAAEEAALTLGANGFKTFWHVTLPDIRWALLYGVLLCNARAMGEFGAVSVVSGHIRGETNTMPLQIEALYDESAFVASFTVASLLAGLAIITLILKTLLEWWHGDDIKAQGH